MAKEINVTQRTQRIHVSPSSGAVTVENSGPQGPAGPTGEVSLATFNAALALKANLASPTFTGTVVVPAATAATHAAQVTAKDPATGRFAIGGVELGDTGWRNITSLLSPTYFTTNNGWAIRRVGNVVYLRSNDSTFGSGVPNAFNIWTVPLGFRGPNAWTPLPMMSLTTSGGTVAGMFRSFIRFMPSYATDPYGLGIYASPTSVDGFRISGTATMLTSDAWPSSLPGTLETAPLE